MGIVYEATDERLGRSVALKVMPPELLADEVRRQRFVREARSAAAVTHPNLATIYEVGEVAGQIFIAMELVEGATLRALLVDGEPLPLARALHLFRGLARGLAAAHRKGVVHRDLKPENVFVTSGDEVKILDFGLAKLADPVTEAKAEGLGELATAPQLTEAGQILGTPSYMSPEQACGRGAGPTSDVFSMGVLLFEMLAGRRPFRGASVVEVIAAVARDEPPELAALNPAVPAMIDSLVARCLAKDPAARPADGGVLLAELEALQTTLSAPRPVELVAPPRLSPRKRSGLVALVLVVTGCLGVTVWLSRHPRTARPSIAVVAPGPAALDGAVPITELPRQAGVGPAAAAEYDAGLQALRDASWGPAQRHFVRAVELDPLFGQAHLRVALTSMSNRQPTLTHEAFRRATALRAKLPIRDQLFLDALEPMLLRAPSDPAAAADLFAKLRGRFPGDAELAFLEGAQRAELYDWQASLEGTRRAVELDPRYADAWQTQAIALNNLGRRDEALRALERCLEVVPSSNDCTVERIRINTSEGRCEEAERDARQTVLRSDDGEAHRRLAGLMLGNGRPLAAVKSTLEQSWQRDLDKSPVHRGADQIQLAIHEGDLLGALALTEKLAAAIGVDRDLPVQSMVAHQRVLLLQELGRDKDAGRVALGYLEARDAWLDSPSHSILHDDSSVMLGVARRAGVLTAAADRDGRRRFEERWRASSGVVPLLRWLMGWALPAETPAEARDALAAAPPGPLRLDFRLPHLDAQVGKLLLLVGRVDEALPLLERAANLCRTFEDPFEIARFRLLLARAYEQKSDRPRACARYQQIVDQLGKARPRSVTVDAARARLTALGCKR